MRKNKFVLDANIWVSYLITNREEILLDILIEHKVTFFYCNELLVEIKRVLQYPHLVKYHINIPAAIKFVKKIGVEFVLSQPIKQYVPNDNDDNYVIALALQTNSGFITSGDKHILSEKENLEKKFKRLKIISKAEFEMMFVNKSQ